MMDLTSFVSFGDSVDMEKLPPKISRQPSRITGLAAAGSSSTTREGVDRRINDLQMTENEKQELMLSKTFRRVQADIKERQKRIKQNTEKEKHKLENQQSEQQFYVDKDKQMVNVQGTICFYLINEYYFGFITRIHQLKLILRQLFKCIC